MEEIKNDLELAKELLKECNNNNKELFEGIYNIKQFETFETFKSFFISELISILPFSGNRTENIYNIIKKYELTEDLIQSLSTILFQINNSSVQKDALSVIVNSFSEDKKDAFLHSILNTNVTVYNFSTHTCMEHHPGLKNLGATCYMNSIIQQLHNLPNFIDLFLSTDFSNNKGYKELQEIFYKMYYTAYPFLTLENFTSKWEWRRNKLINVKEQHDAFEFLQILIENMKSPEIQYLFSSEVTSVIENKDIGLRKEVSQICLGLSLRIKYKSCLEDALDDYIEPELLYDENMYFCEEICDYVVAERTNSIKKFSPILLIQLQRFKYDKKSQKEVKINDPFIFPETINLQKYQNSDKSSNYNLQGVVIHSGTPSCGHYYSLIKINDKWFKFNDTVVSEVTKRQFDDLTIGNAKSSTSASILIYTHESLKSNNLFKMIPATLKYTIENENTDFHRVLFAFSETFMSYIIKDSSNDIFYNYFFNIFLRTSETHNLINKFEGRINKNNADALVSLINEYFVTSFSALMFAKDDIKSLISRIIYGNVLKAKSDEKLEIIRKLVTFLHNTLQSPAYVVYPSFTLCKILCSASKEFIEVVQKEDFLLEIVNIILQMFSDKKKDYFLKKVDASYLMRCIPPLFTSDEKHKQVIEKLESIDKNVKKSSRSLLYYNKTLTAIKEKALEQVNKKEENTVSNEIRAIVMTKEENEMKKLIINSKISPETFVKGLIQEKDLYNQISEHANILFIDYLFSNDNILISEIKNLCKILPQKELVFSFMKVLKSDGNILLMKKSNEFFSLFSEILSRSGINQEEKYTDIIDFIKSAMEIEPSPELFEALKALTFFNKDEETKELLNTLINMQMSVRSCYSNALTLAEINDREFAFNVLFEPISVENLWRLKMNAKFIKKLELTAEENNKGLDWLFKSMEYYFEIDSDISVNDSSDSDSESDYQIEIIENLILFLSLFDNSQYNAQINTKMIVKFFNELFDENQYMPYIKFFAKFDSVVEAASQKKNPLCQCLVLFKKLEKAPPVQRVNDMIKGMNIKDESNPVFMVLYFYGEKNVEFTGGITTEMFTAATLKRPSERKFFKLGLENISDEDKEKIANEIISQCKCQTGKELKRSKERLSFMEKNAKFEFDYNII